MSLPCFAEEEQDTANIFQQYTQKTVRLHDYSQDDFFMNPFMYPWGMGPMGFYGGPRHFGRHRHGEFGHHRGGVYFGPNFWSDNRTNDEHLLDHMPEDTYVDPSTYSFQPEK